MATLVRRTPFRFSVTGLDEATQAQEPLLAPVASFNAIASLDALRARAAQSFEEENARHMLALETLWHCAFPGGAYPVPFERRSEQWKDLGFQGIDPVTDLRGGGYMALEHLVRYVVSSRGAVTRDPSFPLALASIHCTAMLLRHFALLPTLVLAFPGAATAPEASTAALQQLLLLNHLGTDALQALHAALLDHLQGEWERLDEAPTTRTLLDFPVCLGRAYRHLCGAVRGTPASLAPPQAWLRGIIDRLQDEARHDQLFAPDCCVHPGAAFAVLLMLLRSLAGGGGGGRQLP